MAGCNPRREPSRELTIALAVFPAEAERYRSFVAGFETREHVRVRIVAQTYADIFRVLGVQARAGRGTLDLVELDLAMLGAAQGDVSELDSVVTADARVLFPQAAWQAATASGHVYFVPHRLMWQAMIYNRIEVAKPPATWEELERFAREHPGKLALKDARYEGVICDVMPFVWAAGGGQCMPAASGSIRALDFLATLSPLLNPESPVLREMSVLEAQAHGGSL